MSRGALASAILSLTSPSRRWASGTSSRARRRNCRGRRSSLLRDRARPAARRTHESRRRQSRSTVHRQYRVNVYVCNVATRSVDDRRSYDWYEVQPQGAEYGTCGCEYVIRSRSLPPPLTPIRSQVCQPMDARRTRRDDGGGLMRQILRMRSSCLLYTS